MTEYTPTTEEVREAAYELGSIGVTYAGFDRWLNEIRAEAWDEGHGESCEDVDYVCERIHPNPYRNSEK